jgi:predicted ArsR family transcriptional regulator
MFYLGQAVDAIRLILGDELTVDPVKARILDALQGRKAMTATEIYADVFQKNKPAKEIQASINELVEDGQVSATTEPTEGRPKTTYTLNVKNVFTQKAPEADQGADLNALKTLNTSGGGFENESDEVEI